jgi:hypothetical protein
MADTELMIAGAGDRPVPASQAKPVHSLSRIEEHVSWPVLAKLPVTITAEIPVERFCVRDLLGLHAGCVIDTASPETEDVPLIAGSLQLAWTEFEVVNRQLVARLTRLA